MPIVYYVRGNIAAVVGDRTLALELHRSAQNAASDYCLPSRLEELLILEAAIQADPADSRAHFYLGNLLYDKRRHEDAMEHWEAAAELDNGIATVWRNLGIGY